MTRKNYILYTQIQDSLKSNFLFMGYKPRITKVLVLEVLEEKDIKGLKRKERIKEEKSLKLKTLRSIRVKLCNI